MSYKVLSSTRLIFIKEVDCVPIDENMRQQIIRGAEMEDEIENVARLYEKGWSIADIARSKDVKIRSVINALRSYISVKPEDIENAERQAEAEEAAEKFMIRRLK